MKRPFPKMRRHTLYFLREARAMAPVFLDIDIDMRSVQATRERFKQAGSDVSVVSVLAFVIARVFAERPQANVAVGGSVFARYQQYESVHAKITLDKTVDGTRSVFSAVIPHAQTLGLMEIQAAVDKLKQAAPETAPEFERVRRLQKMPPVLGYLLYRFFARSLWRRQYMHGSFAVTSLGHRSIRGFYPITGNTFTFGVGRITDCPIARDGKVVVAPILRLCATFDHRAVDGAIASDVLESIKRTIESIDAGWDGRTLAVPSLA